MGVLFESLREKVAYLDAALTSSSWSVVQHTQRSSELRNEEAALEWAVGGREYYLSDGGYSRIVVSDMDGRLFLTSNSRPQVKEAWGRCRELIADVEAAAAAIRGNGV